MNYKTTTLGVLTIISALASAAIALIKNAPVDYAALMTAITAGVGLIKAADAK